MEKKQIDKEEIAKSSKELFDELGTIIPNELIGDTSISTDARFLYVVLSKNADPEVVNAAAVDKFPPIVIVLSKLFTPVPP